MTCATPDAGELARQVVGLLPEQVHEHPGRGLDHGPFVGLSARSLQAV